MPKLCPKMMASMGLGLVPVAPQGSWYIYLPVGWDNCKVYAYVGTFKGSFQHTPGATGTSLRPLAAIFLRHILGSKPSKIYGFEAVEQGFTCHIGPHPRPPPNACKTQYY